MKREEFRAKAKGSFKGYDFLAGKLKVFVGRRNGKLTDFVIQSHIFRSLTFNWNSNGWCLKTTKPIIAEGFSAPFYAPKHLIWYCKDLYAFPAPDTKHVIHALKD